MALCLIKGTYRVTGTEPDGDSMRFYPTDATAFDKAGIAAHLNSKGGAQLRLDAIDALETHYTPRVGEGRRLHQPPTYAHKAAEQLLSLLGFTTVERDGERVTSSEPAEVAGYILTRFADKYGRPVALAFSGETDQPDLGDVFTDVALLRQSVNYQLAADGLVFPTFYTKLYGDLRGALTDAAENARASSAGLWPQDETTTGCEVSLERLEDQAVILPKLFRRLADYLALGDGDTSLAGFLAYLEKQNDRVWVVDEGRLTGFDDVVEVDGQTVRLLHPPEDLVFVEK